MWRRATTTAAVLGLALAGGGTVPPAAAQPQDLDRWLEVETTRLTLLTDAGAERGAEVAASLERFRAAFARLAPGLDMESPAPTRLIAFRDRTSFAPYRRQLGRGVTVLGQFLSSPDGNVLTLDADPRQVSALAVIYHETVHDLVSTNLPEVPRWFNEGLAEYYSSFVIEAGSVRIGRAVPRHLAWLAEHGVPALDALLGADGDARNGSARKGGARHGAGEVGAFYAGSWLLVHYLMSGDGERLDRTATLLARLASGVPADEAIADVFDLRVGDLEARLAAYLAAGRFAESVLEIGALATVEATPRPAPPAHVLTVLGDLTARLGNADGAAAHFHRALDHDPRHAEAVAGLARLRDRQGRFAEAEQLWRDALALGSDDPVVHLRWGRHLLRTLDHGDRDGEGQGPAARAAGARAAFSRVTELDPTFAEGWAMLGVAHLVGDIDPAPGIASLERAVARLPARVDLVARLIELEARAGRFARAEQRIEHQLAGRVDAEAVAAAREEVARRRLLAAARDAFADGRIDEALERLDEAVSLTSDPVAREALAERLSVLQAVHGR